MKPLIALILAGALIAQTPAPRPEVAPAKPVVEQPKVKRKGGKGKWIAVAVVAAVAVTVLVAANARLGNEGKPLF